MKKIYYSILFLLSFTVSFVACDTEEELVQVQKEKLEQADPQSGDPGNADFSTYVALGNSLTAGFMDGALYTDGQNNSFPNILAKQLQVDGVDGGPFQQPSINSENGFNSTFSDLGSGVIAGRTELDLSIPGPVPTEGELIGPFDGDTEDLNNFGVPGARTADLLNPFYGTPDVGNPYFTRFNSSPGSVSILEDALSVSPTFFTLWIGSNDVLGYALSGGTGDDPLVAYSQAQFQSDYANITTQLVTAGAQGVVVNIPPVLLIPYLRAVPYNPVPLKTQGEVDALNAGYADYNAGIQQALLLGAISEAEAERRTIEFSLGANAFVMEDEYLTDLSSLGIPSYRQTEATDLIPLPTAPALEAGIGTSIVAEDQYVLSLEEQAAVVEARATYSAVIAGIADATPGVEMLDIQPLFADIAGLSSSEAAQLALTAAAQAAADGVQGITIGAYTYAPDFSPNGLFSTDGVHPNPKGHAVVANEIIKVINAKFGASIPEADLTPFRTVTTAQ